MGQALKQINVLWKYAQVHGGDRLLSMTLSKLIEAKMDQYNREIEELEETFWPGSPVALLWLLSGSYAAGSGTGTGT